jgi:hypothetical protein
MLGTYHRLGVHICASDIEVIRKARLKIAEKHRKGREMRKARHEFYRVMLGYHEDARNLAIEFRL